MRVAAEYVNRPPRSGLQRKISSNRGSVNMNDKRKKQAIANLLKDKQMATELIRLYSNTSDLR